MIADVLTLILGNMPVVLFIVAVIVAWVKVRRAAARGAEAASIFWAELVFYVIGLGYVWFGLFHAYGGPNSAKFIGWEPSPFEFELGWAEIGIGLIGILSLWRGYEMRLAATLMFAIFSFAAAAQHIHLILCCANYSPGNAGATLWFGDIALPLIILAFALASRYPRRA
jgi:hypothetical protein